MPAKIPPRLPHVRFTRAKGKLYAYFDTGARQANGRPVYAPMPPFGSTGFYDTYASMKGARTKRESVSYTVANLASDYEDSLAFKDLKPNSQKVYLSSLKKVREYLAEFPVNDLTADDVQAVLDRDIESAGTHNNLLAVMGVIYAWARSPRGGRKTTLRPTEGIEKRKLGEHKPWPEHILEAGIAAENDDIRLAVRLLYFTGQRIGDVLQMRWSDVRDGMIHIVQEKTDKKVWIPMLNELREELDRTPKRGLTIIANERGRKLSDDKVRSELQAFTAALGAKTVPHGLRKNAVNALLEAGCTIAETASITGQSYKIVEHYARDINQRRMAKAAVYKLENKRGQRKPNRKPS